MSKDDLSGKKLDHASLSNTDLSESNLSKASLRHSQLKGANLRNTDLTESDLRGAHLEHADVTGANLHNADLSDADLRGVDLSRAASVEGAKIGGARGIAEDIAAKADDDRVIDVGWEDVQRDQLSNHDLLRYVVGLNQQIVTEAQALIEGETTSNVPTDTGRRFAIEQMNQLRERRDKMEAQLVHLLSEKAG